MKIAIQWLKDQTDKLSDLIREPRMDWDSLIHTETDETIEAMAEWMTYCSDCGYGRELEIHGRDSDPNEVYWKPGDPLCEDCEFWNKK